MSNFINQIKFLFNKDNFEFFKKITKLSDFFENNSFIHNKAINNSDIHNKDINDINSDKFSSNIQSKNIELNKHHEDYKILNKKLDDIIKNMQDIEKYLSIK